MKKAAHFLLTPNLIDSPPNDAITRVYDSLGFEVDFFSPEANEEQLIKNVSYGFRWLIKNTMSLRWRHYDVISCTSEDPIVIAGVLSFVWRRPLIFLSDEIKTGTYSGDRSNFWKMICRWAMRRAELTIVNDNSRKQLQRDYAGLSNEVIVTVYPGCFLYPPKADDREIIRKSWEIDNQDTVLGFSGACNLTAGIHWALESLDRFTEVRMIAQPLTLSPLELYLLKNHRNAKKIYFEKNRLSWQESWRSMGGVDIGIAVYTNQAEQFQRMGISSNRLCMFLAMGVPVIVSKQKSFEFIEDYNCGVMVENSQQFSDAVETIRSNLVQMKENALTCTEKYIDTRGKFSDLESSMKKVVESNK